MQVSGIRTRAGYFFLILTIIALGLLSRKYAAIPLWVGDVLWAMMIFFMVRFFFIGSSIQNIAIASLAICYAVEFSQLYSAPWIDNLRHTFFGGMLLGEVFLWGDLLCYTVGVVLSLVPDRHIRTRLTNKWHIS